MNSVIYQGDHFSVALLISDAQTERLVNKALDFFGETEVDLRYTENGTLFITKMDDIPF